MKLSVSMIVKNEESCLRKCLESVKDADEIIVCDTGSTDSTIEIARSYTDKVFTDYVWNDKFNEARNHALSKCTGDWVLHIDADNELEPNGIQKIKNFLEGITDPNVDGVYVKICRTGGKSHHIFPSIIKRDPLVYWKKWAHNYPVTRKKLEPKDPIVIVAGYSKAHAKDPDRTLRILKKAIKDPKEREARDFYYLAREYWYRNEYRKAIKLWLEYVRVSNFQAEMDDAYLMLARCYQRINDSKTARFYCAKAVCSNPDFKEAVMYMALLHNNNKYLRDRWYGFSQQCKNKDVLFVRDTDYLLKWVTDAIEQDSDYYEKHFENVDLDLSRYYEIYEKIGNITNGCKVLDIGCGVSKLADYVKGYMGFDFIPKAIARSKQKGLDVWLGNVYDEHNYKEADYYVAVEVLEHLQEDVKVINNIPRHKPIIFTVPSFTAVGHVRTYTEEVFRKRYDKYLNIKNISYFQMRNKKWVEVPLLLEGSFILFVECERR